MQRLEVSGAVRPLYGSLGVKGLNVFKLQVGASTGIHNYMVRHPRCVFVN